MKQEVARAGWRWRARRRRGVRPPGREEDDRGGGDGLGRLGRVVGARWAAGELGRLLLFLFIYFFLLFCFI